MARRKKTNIRTGVECRESGYYSTPAFVADFIGKELLRLNTHGHRVLDPCVGREELLQVFLSAGKSCDGYDVLRLKKSYECDFHESDFIKAFIEDKSELEQKQYDYIILNPPYNCHECDYISSNRVLLKEEFEIGAFNTFALFLSAVIDIAPDGCLIGAIVLDTLLSAKAYDKLRRKILYDCTIFELILCPDDLFHNQGANVSPCILVLSKGHGKGAEYINTLDRSSNSGQFKELLQNRAFSHTTLDDIVFNCTGHMRFVVGKSTDIVRCFSAYPSLGGLYKCGGGISTGNDSVFTSDGKKTGYTIPYITNPASSRFVTRPNKYLCDDFLEQSKKHRNFIIRNKGLLHREGIVCSSIGKHFGAAYLPAECVTGMCCAIWPPKEDLYWLLAYMNSSFVTYILKAVVDRGNMTTIAGIKSIPLSDFSIYEKQLLADISVGVINGIRSTETAIAS